MARGVLAVNDERDGVHVAVLAVTNLDVQDARQGPEFELEIFFSRRHHRWFDPFFS